jgi:hypothetical protein
VGYNSYGTIANCYSTGSASGVDYVGGLVGENESGTISTSYSTSTLTGTTDVGGLAGHNIGTISNCYSEGDVSGGEYVGGLVGRNGDFVGGPCFSGTISNCYSTSSVTGGGLVGWNDCGEINASFWDIETSGQTGSEGGTPKTTAEMQMQVTFTDAGWDFVGETVNGIEDIWDVCEGTNYPKFIWQTPLLGDFLCPDGVDFVDYSFFAAHWAEDNCSASNDCDGTDLDLLETVDINDLRIFVDNWLIGF